MNGFRHDQAGVGPDDVAAARRRIDLAAEALIVDTVDTNRPGDYGAAPTYPAADSTPKAAPAGVHSEMPGAHNPADEARRKAARQAREALRARPAPGGRTPGGMSDAQRMYEASLQGNFPRTAPGAAASRTAPAAGAPRAAAGTDATQQIPVTPHGGRNRLGVQPDKSDTLGKSPNRLVTRRRVITAGITAVVLTGGGVVASGLRHSTDGTRITKVDSLTQEAAKFRKGMTADSLSCMDTSNALTLRTTADTVAGVRANVHLQSKSDKKPVDAYLPLEGHMVQSTSVVLCADSTTALKGKPFATFENGQWHVNRAALVIRAIKGQIPGCGLTMPDQQGQSDGACAVSLPTSKSQQLIINGTAATAAGMAALEAISPAEKTRDANLVTPPKPDPKDNKKVVLNPDQHNYMLAAGIGLYVKSVENAENTCRSGFDAQLGKWLLAQSQKKFGAVPQNKNIVFADNYGSLAAQLKSDAVLKPVITSGIATIANGDFHCDVLPQKPQKQDKTATSQPQPTPHTTTTGAKK